MREVDHARRAVGQNQPQSEEGNDRAGPEADQQVTEVAGDYLLLCPSFLFFVDRTDVTCRGSSTTTTGL